MQRAHAGGASQPQPPRPLYRTHASHLYDIDDQIPASVISSVGTVSLSQSTTNPTLNTTMANRTNPANASINIQTSAQQTPTQAKVRNLPKKRKFDPSELEEIERNCINNMAERNCINVSVTTPHQVEYTPPTYQPVLQPSPNIPRSSPHDLKPFNINYPNIDLSEWRDHRVLAKQRGLYIPGVIRQADGCKMIVELDGQENEPIEYSDIFGANKYDVISDASPQLSHLSVGSACVVRTTDSSRESVQNVFVEGLVFEVHNSPIRIRVKVTDGENMCKEMVEVKRADIRLLQPPWADELEDAGSHAPAAPHMRVHCASVPYTMGGDHFVTSSPMPGSGQVAVGALSNGSRPFDEITCDLFSHNIEP